MINSRCQVKLKEVDADEQRELQLRKRYFFGQRGGEKCQKEKI